MIIFFLSFSVVVTYLQMLDENEKAHQTNCRIKILLINSFEVIKYDFQMLNKEHEKAEDAKPATVPLPAANWRWKRLKF